MFIFIIIFKNRNQIDNSPHDRIENIHKLITHPLLKTKISIKMVINRYNCFRFLFLRISYFHFI